MQNTSTKYGLTVFVGIDKGQHSIDIKTSEGEVDLTRLLVLEKFKDDFGIHLQDDIYNQGGVADKSFI